MANERIKNKKMQRERAQQMSALRRYMEKQEEQMGLLLEKLQRQEDYMDALGQQLEQQKRNLEKYYTECQERNKPDREKEHILNYINMRDAWKKDLAYYEENNMSHTYGYGLLKMYLREITEILEDCGVEILEGKKGELHDPTVNKALRKISVTNPEQHRRIVEVYDDGYCWQGIVIKEIYVAVGICE